MKKYNGEKYIVSFTTYYERFNAAAKQVYNLLKKQTYKNIHIVCTLFKEDYDKLNGELKLFVDNNFIEIIVADKNLRPHLKYFYTMLKYKNIPIITIDDDLDYDSDLLENLINEYEKSNVPCVVGSIVPCLKKRGNHLVPYNEWCTGYNRLLPGKVSYVGMAEGFGGVLYPPNCFTNLENELDGINECLLHDDLYLLILKIKNKIITKCCKNTTIIKPYFNKIGNPLNANMNYRYEVTKKFEHILLKGFEL